MQDHNLSKIKKNRRLLSYKQTQFLSPERKVRKFMQQKIEIDTNTLLYDILIKKQNTSRVLHLKKWKGTFCAF